MSNSNQKSNIPMVATIIVAAAAVALAVAAAIMILNLDKSDAESVVSSGSSTVQQDLSYITTEYQEECEYAAHDLLNDSYEILRLFVTEGLYHEDEPYGNLPEDGYYTVNSTDYTSLEQIEELVHSVYTDDAAEQILKNVDGNGLAVYANREQLVKVEEEETTAETTAESSTKYETVYKLGISADFTPDESKSWSSCAITIEYLEEGRCGLTVYLDGVDSSNGITDENKDSVLQMSMIKLDDGWRLTDFVTRGSVSDAQTSDSNE